jgi:hypothetical protein
MNTNAPLIFVYLGKKLPEYVKYSMLLACETSHSEVVLLSEVVLDIKKDNYKNILIQSFYDYSEFKKVAKSLNFDKDFWDGFWLKTLERFFVLKQYMENFEISKCFHAEADNMVFNLSVLSQKLDSVGEFMFIPRPSQDRALASLIYINGIKSIEMLCSYAKEKSDVTNEMQILANFLNKFPNYAKALPTDIAFDEDMDLEYISPGLSGGIFDAAAIGQWLFGVDMRNLNIPLYNHFKNTDLGFTEIEDLKIYYGEEKNILTIEYLNKTYTLFNIHIHSKVHKKIIDNIFFKNVLNKNNIKKRLLIDFNTINTLKGVYYHIRTIVGFIIKKRKNVR